MPHRPLAMTHEVNRYRFCSIYLRHLRNLRLNSLWQRIAIRKLGADLVLGDAFAELEEVDAIFGGRVRVGDHGRALDGAITVVAGFLQRPKHGLEIGLAVAGRQ